MNISQKLASDAVQHLAAQHDKILLCTIRQHLGDETKVESLRGRLEGQRHENGIEQWLLDGRPLIEFHPPQSGAIDMDGFQHINLTVTYRTFDWRATA